MNIKAQNDKYTYRVLWSDEDNEFIGLCAEFLSLSWLDKTPEKALKGIIRVVGNVIEDMRTRKETVPEPIAYRQYSGKFMVRISPQVHRKIAIQSAEYGISINNFVASKLSQ